jgi:hypothetical protein
MAAVLLISLPAPAAQSAATVYALNCLGCHFPPEEFTRDAPPMIGQFAQTEGGRVFFIRTPAVGDKPLDKEQDARLLREVLNWKKSCSGDSAGCPAAQIYGPPMSGWWRMFGAALTGCMLGGMAAPVAAQSPRLEPLPAPATVKPALVKLGWHLFFEPRPVGRRQPQLRELPSAVAGVCRRVSPCRAAITAPNIFAMRRAFSRCG